jgi:putative ABC transport system substrate-binding protein
MTLTLSLLVAPLVADAQPSAQVARIGYLSVAGGAGSPLVEAFRQGLRELGYVEGHNVTMAFRTAEGSERLPALAAELVQLPVDVIVTAGEHAARAVQHATRTIPIVLVAGNDPVELGLVASLARPGGNLTGLSLMSLGLAGKRLELLQEAVPTAARVGVLFDPASIGAGQQWRETEHAAQALGVHLQALEVRRGEELST